MPKTLFDKVWDSHVVKHVDDGPDVLFIDRHMTHEVTSPVAFLGLEKRGLPVLYPGKTFATADHNTPTINQHLPIKDPLSAHIGDAMEMIPFSCSSRSKARPDFWISFSSMYNASGEVCVLLV